MTPNRNSDQTNRLLALNTKESFIVQAPAGSGKTELLMQRFLALLAACEGEPDSILAITFTNKAAHEMKERILKALENAEKEAPLEAHKKQTWQLARSVLEKDKISHWNLLDNPEKLRIQTIDAFCFSLTQAMPLLSTLGANLGIETEIEPYYIKAAENLLAYLETDNPLAPCLFKLLAHLDNHLEKTKALLVDMLKIRDQWLTYLVGDFGASLKTHLRHSLEHLVEDNLRYLYETLPKNSGPLLFPLMRHFAALRQINLSQLKEASLNDWQDLAEKLLTKTNTLRVRWNFDTIPVDKSALEDLRQLLAEAPQWVAHLAEIQALPTMDREDPSYALLDDLVVLLPYLVAELTLIFQEEERVDFSAIAQHALLALGDKDSPTDLTLALDQKLQHILVDEFQDTSITQFRLLEKLTMDWAPHDGRTLFVVGDPMQSIYRFRQAEVSLFLSIKEKGLGALHLTSLALNANFRSSKAIVDWNNRVFHQAFPTENNLDNGAIAYHPSVAMNSDNPPHSIISLAFDKQDKELQANAMLRIIQTVLSEEKEKSIAVLVKSRSHLPELLVCLNAAHIPYQAVEIEKLPHKEIVQDLLSLTLALLNVDDRVSWLSLLRCPWIGLYLADLTHIAHSKHQTIYAALSASDVLQCLSLDAQERLALRLPILEKSLKSQGILPFALWIEDTWRALEGPRLLPDDQALHDSELFFALLRTFENKGIWPKPETIKDKLERLYASAMPTESTRLHIMTIHKAKGLEFDCVILPRLEATPPIEGKPLLTWSERTRLNGKLDLLLAPIPAVADHKMNAPLYDYIRFKNKEKSAFENTRLLYVASTRAKEKLYLLYGVETKEDTIKPPSKGSFLQELWPILKNEVILHQEAALQWRDETFQRKEVISSHSISFKRFIPETSPDISILKNKPVSDSLQSKYAFSILNDTTAQHLGTLLHRILHASSLQSTFLLPKLPHLQRQLLALGVRKEHSAEATKTLFDTMQALPQDKRAQWILNPTHEDVHSEWALTGKIDGVYQQIIIDRSFIDEKGNRWIIDYKTSQPKTNEPLNDFYQRMQEKYTKQLNTYASLLAQLDEHPIRLGLYFPLFQGWWSWSYQ